MGVLVPPVPPARILITKSVLLNEVELPPLAPSGLGARGRGQRGAPTPLRLFSALLDGTLIIGSR